jgi:hypothetical protein
MVNWNTDPLCLHESYSSIVMTATFGKEEYRAAIRPLMPAGPIERVFKADKVSESALSNVDRSALAIVIPKHKIGKTIEMR